MLFLGEKSLFLGNILKCSNSASAAPQCFLSSWHRTDALSGPLLVTLLKRGVWLSRAPPGGAPDSLSGPHRAGRVAGSSSPSSPPSKPGWSSWHVPTLLWGAPMTRARTRVCVSHCPLGSTERGEAPHADGCWAASRGALSDGGNHLTAPKVPEVGAACAALGPPPRPLLGQVRLQLSSCSVVFPAAWTDM